LIERRDTVDLALFDAPQRGVEYFQGARHPQRHQAVLDTNGPGYCPSRRAHGSRRRKPGRSNSQRLPREACCERSLMGILLGMN
jgi:hypothetical protein